MVLKKEENKIGAEIRSLRKSKVDIISFDMRY